MNPFTTPKRQGLANAEDKVTPIELSRRLVEAGFSQDTERAWVGYKPLITSGEREGHFSDEWHYYLAAWPLCDCGCHKPGLAIMHFAPCCQPDQRIFPGLHCVPAYDAQELGALLPPYVEKNDIMYHVVCDLAETNGWSCMYMGTSDKRDIPLLPFYANKNEAIPRAEALLRLHADGLL